MNFAAVQSTLLIHACRMSQNSLVSASYCIYFARSKSILGLNVLLCADRLQSNIDDILSGSSNHIVHSHYNSSIADDQHAYQFFV